MSDSRPIEAWASRLGGKGEPLTMEEGQFYTSIVQCDRLLEIRDCLQDVQARLTRMEVFAGLLFPKYDAAVQRRLGPPEDD